MNKAVLMATSAVAGVVAVVVSHPAGAGVASSAPPAPATSTPATSAPAGPPHSAPAVQSQSAPPTSTGPQPATPSGAVGADEKYGYGELAVKVTVQGSRIVDVSVANLQTAESYSQQLAQQVVPMLRSEVLSAQSARIQGVSGATYTSEAYVYSLQSALDRLHFK
jgi:uncharacterized protein with FMN-binding domain